MISSTGEQLGIARIEDAINRAKDESLDLVEISPMAKPPVCKIMDYGKYKYQENRKKHEAKKKQTIVHLKEIRFRPATDKHDIDFKVKNIIKFLNDGDKVKISVAFRGREMAYKQRGDELLKRVITNVGEHGAVETNVSMEGRQMFVILVPPALAPKTQKKPVTTSSVADLLAKIDSSKGLTS